MYVEIILEKGNVRISNEVIMLIVKKTTEEIEGIAAFSEGLPMGITEVFGKNVASRKGIKIMDEKARVTINFSVVVKYGIVIPEVIKTVQEEVKKAIEAMTDIEVNQINVFVQGVEV